MYETTYKGEALRCPKCRQHGAAIIDRHCVVPVDGKAALQMVSACTFRCPCGHDYQRELPFGKSPDILSASE